AADEVDHPGCRAGPGSQPEHQLPGLAGAGRNWRLGSPGCRHRLHPLNQLSDTVPEPGLSTASLRPHAGHAQPITSLPMTPNALSSPTSVSMRIAASALVNHLGRCGELLSEPVQAMAAHSSPSTKNHGSLKSRSGKSASR